MIEMIKENGPKKRTTAEEREEYFKLGEEVWIHE